MEPNCNAKCFKKNIYCNEAKYEIDGCVNKPEIIVFGVKKIHKNTS